jgi:hypothetical protein
VFHYDARSRHWLGAWLNWQVRLFGYRLGMRRQKYRRPKRVKTDSRMPKQSVRFTSNCMYFSAS